ncbi:MAG: kinase [Candidatus Nezhaarchaeota archaeon]|nr:kinase [Candidatus Nezhaarchaeota archaeon]MCX8141234.1 kinase [Candidatus Nezhaarchaeota archaeon]MDW8049500.1 kinase [Nitrososphaerota archaeon]
MNNVKIKDQIEVCVWVPCHVTSFFEIIEHENALETGSRGAGLNLDIGVKTYVKLSHGDSIEVTGGNEVSRDVVERILQSFGVKARVQINHESIVPMGVGYGVSGATALGAALAISVALGDVMTVLQAGALAHVVEVEHLTGLGDVIAQVHGGIEIRVREGAPGIGLIDWIPYNQDLRVVVATLRSMSTRDMLELKRDVINKSGSKALSRLLRRPTIGELMVNAKIFAEEVNFMDGDLKELAEMLISEGAIGASVKKGVFYALARKDKVDKLHELLSTQLKGKQVITCGISSHGPRLEQVKRL